MKNLTISLNFLLGILLLVMSNEIQAQNYVWAKSTTTTSGASALPNLVEVDASGNVYTVGSLYGTVDFDPGIGVFNLTGNASGQDVYIQKLDANGNFVWAKLIGSVQAYVEVTGFQIDNANNLLLSGNFDDAVDFDPGTAVNTISPQGFGDAFLLKLNSSGAFQWVKTFGEANSYVAASALKLDNSSNILMSGSYFGSVDFDPGTGVQTLNSGNGFNAYLLKLNNAANFTWVKEFVTSSSATLNKIDVDASNNIYCGGNFDMDLDLDPGVGNNTVSAIGTDLFLVKLNASGNFTFGKVFSGNDYKELRGLRVDNSGNIYMAGNFYDQVDFDPGPGVYNLTSNSFSMDMFVVKLNNLGAFQWAKQTGDVNDEYLSSMDIDQAGNVYTTGYFDSNVDFDPGAGTSILNTFGTFDIFLQKLNASGGFTSATHLGSAIEDGAFVVKLIGNTIYNAGIFNSTVDFDPSSAVANLTASSNSDGDTYIFKWSQCTPSTTTINATGCSYTLNGQTYSGNGTYTQVLVNSAGCDSIITLNLSGSSTNTTLNPTVCGTNYVLNGQTYSTTGTYTQFYTNAAGCDSNTIINLVVGNSSSYTYSDVGCDFYQFGNQFLSSSGQYSDTITNSTGCDSIVTLNLTIYQSTYNSIFVNTCGPYTFGGQVYSTSGQYQVYYQTVNGCDSIVELNLTINPIPNTIITQSSCSPITINGQTYSSSGTYNQLYTNAQGCDSMIVLNLTISTPNINITQSGAVLTSSAGVPATYQWLKCNPFAPIGGATSQSYTVTANGSYAVAVSLNGCTDTSLCKMVTGIGIDEVINNNSIRLYPNPTSDKLTVEFEHDVNNLNVKITSITGQIISEFVADDTKKIDLRTEHLSKGIYMLVLQEGGQKQVFKFTKE